MALRGPDHVLTIAYGTHADNVGDLRLPEIEGPFPTVVLLHGGFWLEPFTRELMDGLARDLTGRGYATWNLEFRRVGASGGGWAVTALDVAAGVDHLAQIAGDYDLDLSRVLLLGHSSGGHLALWAASRHRLPQDAPGAGPRFRPAAVVSLAGVSDLAATDNARVARAVNEFLGPLADESVLQVASPIELLPLGAPQLLVHGDQDDIVPLAQSQRYVDAAQQAGDSAELLLLPETDHFALIDAASEEWDVIASRIAGLLRSR